MRAALVLLPALLLVAACSFEGSEPETDSPGLSVAPQNPNIPTGEDGDLAYPGGFARGERIDELFCE